jgi:hypothetical protein
MSGPIGGFAASTYDVECFPNFSMVGVLDIGTGNIRQFTTEPRIGETLADFREFFAAEKMQRLWINFNGLGYDNFMVKAMLDGVDDPAQLYTLSVNTINNDDWRHKLEEIDGEVGVDLLAMYGGKNAKLGSLKEIGVKVGYPHLQELRYAFDKTLDHDEMVEVTNYNLHDIRITAIAALISEPQIAMRVELSAEFGIRVVNKHDAGLAEAVMAERLFGHGAKMYPSATAWHLSGDDLVKNFTFTHPALIELRERIAAWDMRMAVVEEVEKGQPVKRIEGSHLSEAVKLGEKGFTIGHGGLHSVDEAGLFESDARHVLLDFDLRSAYPSIIQNHRLVPQHLPVAQFLREFDQLRKRRLAAKDAGRIALSNGLKVAINSLFGKTGSAYGWLTDPTALLKCTVFGQLTLLTFVDLLQVEGVDIVSSNTDGITFRVCRDIESLVRGACDELATEMGYELEWVTYSKLFRRDINNFVAIGADGKLKCKGAYAFDPNDLGKKATNRIAILAAQKFFADGVPVRETVEACRDIEMFVDYFKCAKPYRIVATVDGSDHDLGRITRWYLGVGDHTRHLDKLRTADGQKTQLVAAGAVIINDLPAEFPEDVDFAAYVAMAEVLVVAITDPEIKFTTTLARADWSREQCARHQTNFDTRDADLDRCKAIDLDRARTDWTNCFKGSGYDSMKSILVRLWLGHGGTLSRGDLLWCAEQLDEADGYFSGSMRRTLTRMVDWVARDVSAFRLPQNTEEVVQRAIIWANEHVEPLKRKRKLRHRNIFTSDFINGDAIRRYGKTSDEYKLACSVCAATVKHGIPPDEGFIIGIIGEVKAYFSEILENSTNEAV